MVKIKMECTATFIGCIQLPQSPLFIKLTKTKLKDINTASERPLYFQIIAR